MEIKSKFAVGTLTLFMLLFIFLIPFAEDKPAKKDTQKFYTGQPKKDPILASSISWYIPGGGQFYSEKYTRGTIFLVTEAGLFIYSLSLVADYSYDLGNGFLMDPKSDVTKKDKQLAWGLGTVLAGIHLYNIIDAYHSAKNFNNSVNRKLKKKNQRYIYLDRKDPFVAGLLSWKMPGLGQIYNKEYYKGSKFILGSLILKTWGIYIYQDLAAKYKESDSGISWQTLEENDKNLILTYGIFYFTFELINILDAVNQAKKYNRYQRALYDKKLEEVFSMGMDSNHLQLKFTWKF